VILIYFQYILLFQDCELTVYQILKWEISIVTPHDFVEQILFRLGLDADSLEKIRRHSRTSIALCSTGEFQILYMLQLRLVGFGFDPTFSSAA